MIQVILLILKIIGITFLVLLGLLLLILTLILFVPIFYRVRIIYNPEKLQVSGRVRFLFPLLEVTFQYLKKFSYKLRVFFVSVLDSEKPKKEKKEKITKKRKKKLKKEKNQEKELVSQTDEPSEQMEEQVEEVFPEPEEEPQTEKKSEPEKKTGFFEKIRLKWKRIRETISKIVSKIKKLLHQKEKIQQILGRPSTKKALSFVWSELKHLLKHILPRKIKGYVAYGADNPATTGQVLGVLSIIYAKTGQLLEIRPNFEEKQLECDVELKGQVQVFTLLVIAVKVFTNKELRKLIAEFRKLKEID